MRTGNRSIPAAALAGLLALAGVASQAGQLPELVTPEIDAAVQRGLKFLADHQQNGAWSSGSGEAGPGEAPYTVFHTALCGIALLQSGGTPHEGPYADHIMKAVNSLKGTCHPDGYIAIPGGDAGRTMYGHGLAMLFLSQTYGMVHNPTLEAELRDTLARAVAFSARYQSRNGGWNYNPTTTSDEGSVAITQIHGLRACQSAGIPVPKNTVDRFVRYVESLENGDGSLAYTPDGRSDKEPGRWAVTCAGAASFFFAGASEHPLAGRLRKYVSDRALTGKGIADAEGHAEYVRFCLSTALFLWRDDNWAAYYRRESKKLLETQLSNGSWNTKQMGDIYGTGMALYFLQLPYKQLPILQQ
jgi:hypothetical protein